MYKTLIYRPDVKVEIVSEGRTYDVSDDVISGSVQRVTGTTSSATIRLANRGLRYNKRFKRMDRIQISLKRIEWKTVFTGYLDSVPVVQLYPGTVTLRASCTLKRLLHTWWDPGLDASLELLDQQKADVEHAAASMDAGVDITEMAEGSTTGAMSSDAGLGMMLKKVLVKVGGWDESQIHIQDVPSSFVDYLMEAIGDEDISGKAEKFKDLFGWNESISTGGGGGGGDMGDATFSSIGPPANGSSYTMDELVSIVSHAGWSGDDVAIGASIIMAESSGNPGAINTANSNGTIDRGLWQINSIHEHRLRGGDWFDPAVSTRMAREIYQDAGNTWQPWSTFSFFGTNANHLADARAAVARGIGPLPAGSQTKDGKKTDKKNVDDNNSLRSAASNDKKGAEDNKKTDKTSEHNIAENPSPPPNVGETGTSYIQRLGGRAPNTQGMTVADSIAAVALYKFPMMTYTSGERYTDNGFHSKKMAADISNGGNEGTPEMKQLAQWWYDNFFGKGCQELIHSPFNNNVGADENVGDGMTQYYNPGTMSEHRNHVHIAMLGVVSVDGTTDGSSAVVGGGGGSINFENKLGKSLFNYIFDPASLDQGGISNLFTGERAPVNDERLFSKVKEICDASMRDFQSSPTGEFLAFYPDYFGLDGTEAVLRLEDIEIKDFHIDANDDAIATHVYIMGNAGLTGLGDMTEYGWLDTYGVATIENEKLFERLTKFAVQENEFSNAQDFLGRYGLRPFKDNYSNVTTKEMEFLLSANIFMRKWAEQYKTTVDFTFMPELFPGMRIELVSHNVTVYVNSVTHNFSFDGGFTTSASVMAPSSTVGTVSGIPGTSTTNANHPWEQGSGVSVSEGGHR